MKQMDAFNKPEYYPVPSESVISYAPKDEDHRGRRQVLKADLPALIVFLTSPEDDVDYTAISDFFLIYRNFISPMELSDLLILRLRWCIREVDSSSDEQKRIGKITLVRTFVLLRHWVLNYFVQNFLPDVNLRLRVIKFLNEPCESYPRIVKSIIVNLKKAWVRSSKRVWTNLTLDEPLPVGQDERWALYEIKDYTQLEELRKRDSRLSAYAKNGSSSPNFRNQSVLSLFKESDVFKIPDSVDATSRTASMVLFPCDNSNHKTEFDLEEEDKFDDGLAQGKAKAGYSGHKRMVSNLSKMTNVSGMLKDVKESVSPNLDQLIPPTPAKKVELILKLREDIDGAGEMESGVANGGKTVSSQDFSVERHHGPIALLSKWKKNHSRNKKSQVDAASAVTNSFAKPEMDNFVKYVISITSLDNKAQEFVDPETLVNTKFDILSARTIEEVEFLVSLENELINRVQDTTIPHYHVEDVDLAQANDQYSIGSQGFSAMDNLNLYQTVSSIANSVVSLSNNLNQRSKIQNGALSPSSAALERRKVQSSMAAILRSNSRFSLVSRNNSIKESVKEPIDGPQRLVFHDSASLSREKNDDDRNPSETAPQLDKLKKRYSQSPTRTSPLRNNLPSLAENQLTTSGDDSAFRVSTYSSITYDSQLSTSSRATVDDAGKYPDNENQNLNALKRKEAQNNLREFTFEKQREILGQDIESVSSFVTTRESIAESHSASEHVPSKVTRPASGRVSIMKKQNIVRSPLKSIEQANKEDLEFIKRDKELLKNELEVVKLQRKTASMTASVDTEVLFASRKNSPKKIIKQETPCFRLSTTPSIRSIAGESSIDVITAAENKKGSTENGVLNQEAYKKELSKLNPENSMNSSLGYSDFDDSVSLSDAGVSSGLKNKYLFSPDSDSVDIASPAKNVEELKDKFLNKDEDTSLESSQEELGSANELADDAGKLLAAFKDKAVQEENIVNIASLPDDSVHDDPVNVALMKLEGTYKKESNNKTGCDQKSRSSSILAEEVDMLGIADLSVPQMNPNDRRRSLLIEKRRQTIMNIPFTPGTDKEEKSEEKSLPVDVKQLLQDYQLKDPNLLIENNNLHISFILMYDSLSIAQQMTLIERELLSEIDWNELLNLKLAHSAPRATSWLQLLVQNESLSGINLAIARFNLVVDWVVSEIVLTADIKLKRNTIQRFIHVAEHCRLFQNYNTMMEIVLALGSTTVQKFSEAWRLIEPGDLITWEELKVIPSLDRNYASIRKLLNNVEPLKGCVPFIVLYLSDISLNSEKKSWFVENQVVNYNKFDTNLQMVKNFIQRVQWSKYYDFPADHELLSKCVYLTTLTQDEIEQLIR